MTELEQLIALHKLAGWKIEPTGELWQGVPKFTVKNEAGFAMFSGVLDKCLAWRHYLTSRDYIVDLVNAWCGDNLDRLEAFESALGLTLRYRLRKKHSGLDYAATMDYVMSEPAHLAEALLRAAGEWKENEKHASTAA